MNKMCPVVHFEMPSEDRQRMAKFYENAFGWQTRMLGQEMGNYVSPRRLKLTKTGRRNQAR